MYKPKKTQKHVDAQTIKPNLQFYQQGPGAQIKLPWWNDYTKLGYKRNV